MSLTLSLTCICEMPPAAQRRTPDLVRYFFHWVAIEKKKKIQGENWADMAESSKGFSSRYVARCKHLPVLLPLLPRPADVVQLVPQNAVPALAAPKSLSPLMLVMVPRSTIIHESSRSLRALRSARSAVKWPAGRRAQIGAWYDVGLLRNDDRAHVS